MLKVLFLGYGEIGCLCLEQLIRSDIEVIGVVPRTSDLPDIHNLYSVSKLARTSNLPLFSHKQLSSVQFLEYLRSENLDYVISVQYDRILRPPLINTPQLDCLNLHFSLLPRLRGCYPTKWAIIEESTTGVTLHSIDEGIDTGDILDQVEVDITSMETDFSLYQKCVKAANSLFEKNIIFMKERDFPKRRTQINENSSCHPQKLPFEGFLDLHNNLDFCDRFLRAFTFPPFPPAHCILKNKEVGLQAPVHKEKKSSSTVPGNCSLRKDKLLAVECLDGILYFDKLWVKGEKTSPHEFFLDIN
jgi:methionyl-tRNA formyltransferase